MMDFVSIQRGTVGSLPFYFQDGKMTIGTQWNGHDAPLNIYTDGVLSRPGVNVVFRNTTMSRPPAFIAQNFDSAGDDVGVTMAFYGRDGIVDIQHGLFGFSQSGVSSTKAKFELFLRSNDDSLPVWQAVGTGVKGYAYTLFGPNGAAFASSYPYGAYTPGCTVHVACDTGDVDSGIRIERKATTAKRFNFFIDSSGDLQIRETDTAGAGILLKHTSNSVSIKGTTTNDNASAGYVGEYVSSNTTSFGNEATTGQFGNVTSISLTAGDWDVSGIALWTLNGATIADHKMAISTNSGNTTTDHVDGLNVVPQRPAVSGADVSASIPAYRLSLSTTTTVYLKTLSSYSAGTPQAKGSICARRVR